MAEFPARAARSMTLEWTELAYQEQAFGARTLLDVPAVRAVGCRCWRRSTKAGRCRSRDSDRAVTLLSALAGVWLTGGDSNVFTQVSFLVLAGLACKNAILIVEFAKQREHDGESRPAARFWTRAVFGSGRC